MNTVEEKKRKEKKRKEKKRKDKTRKGKKKNQQRFLQYGHYNKWRQSVR